MCLLQGIATTQRGKNNLDIRLRKGRSKRCHKARIKYHVAVDMECLYDK